MGADLITFILVGPEKINFTSRLQAKALKVAKRAISDLPEDENEDPFGFRTMSEADLTETIQEFVNFWNSPDSRDVNARGGFRVGGKTLKILVAGDSTWGDAPDGIGYQTCLKGDILNLFSVLGIK